MPREPVTWRDIQNVHFKTQSRKIATSFWQLPSCLRKSKNRMRARGMKRLDDSLDVVNLLNMRSRMDILERTLLSKPQRILANMNRRYCLESASEAEDMKVDGLYGYSMKSLIDKRLWDGLFEEVNNKPTIDAKTKEDRRASPPGDHSRETELKTQDTNRKLVVDTNDSITPNESSMAGWNVRTPVVKPSKSKKADFSAILKDLDKDSSNS